MLDASPIPTRQSNAEQKLVPLDELTIDIWPDWEVRYYGTSAQLTADGLIPDGLKWPQERERREWKSGGCTYSIQRRRPDSYKGRVRCWDEVDSWCISVQVTGRRGSGWDDHLRLKKAELALEAARHSVSPEGQRAASQRWRLSFEARKDKAFQQFMRRVPGLVPPKRGRPAKQSASAGNATGADHA